MRAAAIVTAVVLAAPGGAAAAVSEEAGRRFLPERVFVPSWLSETYSDGTIRLRYPQGWIRNETERFGAVVSDTKSPTPAFVGVRYLPKREYETPEDFARVVVRLLRPPDGQGTTVVYTQASRIGGLYGVEAMIAWQMREQNPLGPIMRVHAIELPSSEVALLTFASERARSHNAQFAWIKKTVVWE